MIEQRPDEAKFQMFTAKFIAVDDELELFCKLNAFAFEKNPYRQPGRVLRKGDNPICMIDIFLVEYWYASEFSENLRYTMICGTHYVPETDPEHLWKLNVTLLNEVSFQIIRQKLREQLAIAFENFGQWTPAVILKEGEKKDNLRYLNRDHFK